MVDRPEGSKILVIAPHPDDDIIGCGGTIRLHRQLGHTVTILYVTDGERGIRNMNPIKTAELRRHEAGLAARHLGVDEEHLYHLHLRDGDMINQCGTNHDFRSILEKANPDVIYLRPERLKELHGQPDGADLVMEVVSEGKENRDRDLITKRAEYAAAGIEEYWIVDPESRSVTVLFLDRTNPSQYRDHGVFVAGSLATSVLLPGFSVNVTELFAQADAAAE